MNNQIAINIENRGYPMISDYIPLDKLQQILINAPAPSWGFPPYQFHFPTSPSGYTGCPENVRKGQPSFVMVRGTQFHEHYGPIIQKAFGLKEGQSSMEPMAVMPITCDICESKHEGKDGCGVCQFPFGGSLDFPIWINEWLVDFKFSMQSPEKMNAYVWQMAAYAAMINEGFIRKEPHGAKNTWVWEKSNYRIKYISILHVHPDTFYCTEIRVPIIPFEEIKPFIIEHHNAKSHGLITYRPNPYCKNCENYLKPHMVLTQPKRGAVHQMNLEPNEDGVMAPQVELSCKEMGREYDSVMDRKFEIQIFTAKGEIKPEEIKEIKEKEKAKSPKPPKLYTSKRSVRCKKCEQLTKRYYKLNKKNHCEKCALELGLLPPIVVVDTEKKPTPDIENRAVLNVDLGDDGTSDLIGDTETPKSPTGMNALCKQCGREFTPIKGVLRCDGCLHPTIIKEDNGMLAAKLCYYYKNGACEGAVIHQDGMLEACNYPMNPHDCEQFTENGLKLKQEILAAQIEKKYTPVAYSEPVENVGEDYVAHQKRERSKIQTKGPSIYDNI